MAALKYLETQRAAQPELAKWYNALADLYERKLWHQLTLKQEQFVALAVFQEHLERASELVLHDSLTAKLSKKSPVSPLPPPPEVARQLYKDLL